MSINTELQQLKQTKTGIRAAILDRGVKVGNEAYSLYPDRIRAITTTAGTYDNFLKALLGGNITDLVIPDGTTRIRSSLFSYNTTIETLYVPSSVERIDMMAFWECTNLTSVEFEEGITVIGSDAFRNCTGLTSVTIPASVTIFDAFTGCSSLTDITFLSETPPELGQYSLDGTNDCPIYVPDESVDAYKTANNWTRYASRIQAIPDNSFAMKFTPSDGSAETIVLLSDLRIQGIITPNDVPNTISTVTGSLEIGEGVTTIDEKAFYNCKRLKSVIFPNTLTAIEDYAFYNCLVAGYNFTTTTPPTLGTYSLGMAQHNYSATGYRFGAGIFVPSGYLNAYKTASGWSNYTNVLYDDSYAFWAWEDEYCEYANGVKTGNRIYGGTDVNYYSSTFGQYVSTSYADYCTAGESQMFEEWKSPLTTTNGSLPQFLIIASDRSIAVDGRNPGTNSRTGTVTITDGKIIPDENTTSRAVTINPDTFEVKNTDGKWIYANGSSADTTNEKVALDNIERNQSNGWTLDANGLSAKVTGINFLGYKLEFSGTIGTDTVRLYKLM